MSVTQFRPSFKPFFPQSLPPPKLMDPEEQDNDSYSENATFKERMVWYVSRDQEDKAKALVQLLTQLESNLEWEISIFVEDRD
jgi:hypothetical protein